MHGLSFFGVTPGFSQKDLSPKPRELAAIISACRELHTLDQFSVRLPPVGTLHVVGGQSTHGQRVSFLGRYRHAIEYRGNRDGGYYGAGLWLADRWVDEHAASDLLDGMMSFLREHLIDAGGRVQRTFDEIAWEEADEFLRRLGRELKELRIGPPDLGGETSLRKLLIVDDDEDARGKGATLSERTLRYCGSDWLNLGGKVFYFSADDEIVRSILDRNRIPATELSRLAAARADRQSPTVPQLPPMPGRSEARPASFKDAVPPSRSPPLAVRDDFSTHSRSSGPYAPSRTNPDASRSAPDRAIATGPASGPDPGHAGLLRGYMKPMLWYCFATTNVALVMCAVIAAAVFLDGGGGKRGPRSDPRGHDVATTDPAPTAGAPSYEMRARTAPVVAPDPTGPNANPADGGRPDDDRQSGATAMKIGTEVLCPRRAASTRETSVDRLRGESQALSIKTRGMEARLTKMLQDKDSNASIAKVDVESLVVLLQRERSYLRCLEQLP